MAIVWLLIPLPPRDPVDTDLSTTSGEADRGRGTDRKESPETLGKSEPPFEIPGRPDFSSKDGNSNPSSQLSQLRGAVFDSAERIVKRFPREPEAICLLGKLHLRSGSVDTAKKLWDYALSIDRKSIEPLIDLGNYELKQGRPDEAEKRFRDALSRDANRVEGHALLAESLVAQGKAEEAMEHLEKALIQSPGDSQYWVKLGQAQGQAGKFVEAEKSYRRALGLNPRAREAIYGLVQTHRRLGNQSETDEFEKKLQEFDKSEGRAAPDRASSDLDLAKMQEVANFVFRSASQLLLRAGDINGAIGELELGLRMNPNSRELRDGVIALSTQSGNISKVVQLLREECEQNPSNAEGWLQYAVFCMKNRRLDAAESGLKRFLELKPESDRGYALLSQTQMPAGRNPDGAIENAKRAVEINPSSGNHLVLATAYFHKGDHAKAKFHLTQSLAIDPSNQEAIDALSRLP